jgi:hypothetical protein
MRRWPRLTLPRTLRHALVISVFHRRWRECARPLQSKQRARVYRHPNSTHAGLLSCKSAPLVGGAVMLAIPGVLPQAVMAGLRQTIRTAASTGCCLASERSLYQ